MIDYDAFLQWAESRFDNIKVNGKEIKVNSPFCDDHKNHLWCNVDGGKHERRDGVYRCWKTDKIGTLVGLVMDVDGCDYEDALDLLKAESSMKKIYKELEEFEFSNAKPDKQETKELSVIRFPDYTYPLVELQAHAKGREAIVYLQGRKIDYEKYNIHFCTNGDYANRIILPYYNWQGELIYWNGRHLNQKAQPKYLGPDQETWSVGKGEVLFFTDCELGKIKTPPKQAFLTEGEFDAIALAEVSRISALACGGKTLTEDHIEMIRGIDVFIALDNDKAGKGALKNMGNALKQQQFNVAFVHPPPGIKDWNDLILKVDAPIVRNYLQYMIRPYTKWMLESDN